MITNVQCTIDNRERKLISLLADANIIVKAMDIGDCEISVEHEGASKKYIFERKTIADLQSSIKDGRWREQKMRCVASGANIVYIIEEWSDACLVNEPGCTTAIINLVLKGNVKVIMTTSVEGTANLIRCMLSRIEKEPVKYIEDKSAHSYEQCQIQVKKKANVTKRSILINQLCTVPGISYKKAVTIIDTCNITCMSDLCEKMKEDPNLVKSCNGIGKSISDSLNTNLF